MRASHVFEIADRASLPGFFGAPINIFVMLDLSGLAPAVRLMSHTEPIFLSGRGAAPLRKFFAL